MPLRLDPVAEEAFAHREAGADQPGLLDSVGGEPVGGDVGDVEQRDPDRRLDRRRDLVGGVAAQDQPLGAGRLEPRRGRGDDLADLVPFAGQLERRDRREIEALDDERRRAEAALAPSPPPC